MALPRNIRFALWCAAVALLSAGQIVWIILLRRTSMSSHWLIGGQIFFTIILLGVFVLLRTTPPRALRLSDRASRRWILGVAAALQGAALLLLLPALSDDIFRYRLDGRLWLSGISPYATTPSQAIESPDFDDDALDGMVGFPSMHTIYPPVSQLSFIIGAALWPEVDNFSAPVLWRDARSLSLLQRGLAMRLIFVLAAVAATALLVRMFIEESQSPWPAVLFAWSPLVVIEVAAAGHQDILGVLAMLGAVYAARRGRFELSGALLAVACGVKPFAALLLPFVGRDAYLSSPANARKTLGIFLLTITSIYLPASLFQNGFSGWMRTAQIYSTSWEANGSIYEWFKSFADDDGVRMQLLKEQARLLMICLTLFAGLALWQFRARLETAGYWLFLILLLASPVVYPWYLIWMLAFVPLPRNSAAGLTGLVWSATIVISYLSERSHWRLSAADLQYIPVYAALVIEMLSLERRYRALGSPLGSIGTPAGPGGGVGCGGIMPAVPGSG